MHAGRITAVQNSRHRELFFNQFASLEILLSGIFIVKIYILFKIQAASPQARIHSTSQRRYGRADSLVVKTIAARYVGENINKGVRDDK
jgi:hypothetical protein